MSTKHVKKYAIWSDTADWDNPLCFSDYGVVGLFDSAEEAAGWMEAQFEDGNKRVEYTVVKVCNANS